MPGCRPSPIGRLDWKQQAPAGFAGLVNRAGLAVVLSVDDKRSCTTPPLQHHAQDVDQMVFARHCVDASEELALNVNKDQRLSWFGTGCHMHIIDLVSAGHVTARTW